MNDTAPAVARTALIVGLGRSGVSAARHLAALGWQLAVTDSRLHPPGSAELAAFAPQAICRFGGFDPALLAAAGLVVVSPGVSLAEPMLRSATERGMTLVGDIELFARAQQARVPVTGITGTNGKSTVTTLVGQMVCRSASAAISAHRRSTCSDRRPQRIMSSSCRASSSRPPILWSSPPQGCLTSATITWTATPRWRITQPPRHASCAVAAPP